MSRGSACHKDPDEWGRARIGAVLLALACNVVALCLLWRDDASPLGCLLWLVSLGGGLLAVPSWSRRTSHSEEGVARSETDRGKTGHGSLFLVALVLLLAAVLRLYRLHDLPPGVFIDETNAAMDALEILDGKRVSPFATGWFQTPTLYAYYMAGLFRLLGVSSLALKLTSVLPGLLTVAGLYPLGRRIFGPLPALLGLVLLATARWHVHMSRWGWNALLPPLGQVLVAYLLLRGLETGRPRDFALAGLTLGLAQYTYLAARLIPLMVLFFLLHQVVTEREFLRRHGVNLFLLVVVALMAFAPLGLTYVKNPFLLTNRARQVSILPDLQAAGGLQPLWDNVVSHLLMFNYQGDANPRHNLPQTPMLDPFTGALLLPAAGCALYRWRDRRYALLSCWIAVTLLGGVFSAAKEAPQAYRTLGALPAVALLLGDLLARLWRRLLQPGSRVCRALALAAGVAFLALSGYHNVQAYFVSYAQDPRTFWGFSPLETGVARTVSVALPTHDVYVVPKLAHFSSLRFATYQRPDRGGGGLAQSPYEPFSPLESLPLPRSSSRDVLLVLETQYRSLVPFISHYYPEAEARMHPAPDGQPLYVTVEIPRQALTGATSTPPPGQGLLGQYFLGETWQGEPVMRRVDPLLLFHWYGGDPLLGSFSVRWEGEIFLPEDGAYFFALVGDDGVRLWLDGELVGQSLRPDASNAVEARRTLEAGPHSIRVEYFQRSGAKLIEFRWARPGAILELVPPEVLRPPGRQGQSSRCGAG
ncbi:MAG: glycosyltransferase family 39 protein [Anaerolineae bacterium]|nr:MAG: glycosyltransferase family 39 protein [Anaerolineae bacterium]